MGCWPSTVEGPVPMRMLIVLAQPSLAAPSSTVEEPATDEAVDLVRRMPQRIILFNALRHMTATPTSPLCNPGRTGPAGQTQDCHPGWLIRHLEPTDCQFGG